MKQADLQNSLLTQGSDSIENDEEIPHISHGCQLHDTKHFNRAAAIILGLEYLQDLAYFGILSNLVIYLHDVLHEDNASNAVNVSTFIGTSYLTPVIGAVLADASVGKYKMVLTCLVISFAGMAVITLSAAIPSLRTLACEVNPCNSANGVQYVVFFMGLYLVAVGGGGLKSTLLSFGAEQFDDHHSALTEKASYFNWYFISASVGAVTAGTIIVWIQENVGWALGYSIATLSIALATIIFAMGMPTYRVLMPTGSPLKSILQVLTACFWKMNLTVPTDEALLYKEDVTDLQVPRHEILVHTNEFRFLDKAAIMIDADLKDGNICTSWRLCTVTQVEELKILLRVIPIWVTCGIYAAAVTQISTTFIQQGSKMNSRIGSFSIPPASLASFELVASTGFVLMYEKVLIPATRRYFQNPEPLTELQRMGIGHFFMTVTMMAAAYVEYRRLSRAKAGAIMSIAWLLPQYLITAIAEAFMRAAQLAFFYNQSPKAMRSTMTAFVILSASVGSFFSSNITWVIASITAAGGGKPGWIPEDLNNGHLDYFYFVIAIMSALNCAVFLVLAKKYTPKNV